MDLSCFWVGVNDYMSSFGLTTWNIATGKSKIYVLYSQANSVASDYEVTLAHEFNHAVMSAYQITTAEIRTQEIHMMQLLIHHIFLIIGQHF